MTMITPSTTQSKEDFQAEDSKEKSLQFLLHSLADTGITGTVTKTVVCTEKQVADIKNKVSNITIDTKEDYLVDVEYKGTRLSYFAASLDELKKRLTEFTKKVDILLTYMVSTKEEEELRSSIKKVTMFESENAFYCMLHNHAFIKLPHPEFYPELFIQCMKYIVVVLNERDFMIQVHKAYISSKARMFEVPFEEMAASLAEEIKKSIKQQKVS